MLVFFRNLRHMEFQVRYLTLFLLFSVIDGFEWFWKGSLHRNIQLLLEFLKGPFLVLHFSYFTLITFLMVLSVILLSMLIILLSILNMIRHLICGNNHKKRLVHFNTGKTQLVSFHQSHNTGAMDVEMDGYVLEEKSFLKILGLTFSSKWDWGSYTISIAKTASKKIGALIHSMKFLSPEGALYIYISTICPCMEYCCHVWAGAPSCFL